MMNCQIRKTKSFFLIAILACAGSASYAAEDQMSLLHQSKPLVTRAGAWHTWNDHIHLKPGQEELPLRLTFMNGADGRPKATDMKVLLDRKPLSDFKDFKGGDSFSLDLSGKLQPGNTSLAVQGFGPTGAWIRWQLQISRPMITSVEPSLLGGADTVTVRGTNFSTRPERLNVSVGGKHAKLISSSKQEIKFKMPGNAGSGKRQLVVSFQSVPSAPFMVSVKASAPHISKIDMLSSPPQHPVTIFGSGFSPVAAENVVTFGGHKAIVTAATESSITCIIPEMHFPQWHVPIKVTTNGAASKENFSINVDVRVIENAGVPIP